MIDVDLVSGDFNQEVFMQVKLRVIGGKNDGREIKIGVSEFVIGRSQSFLENSNVCVLIFGACVDRKCKAVFGIPRFE